jgi:hypothetical protein
MFGTGTFLPRKPLADLNFGSPDRMDKTLVIHEGAEMLCSYIKEEQCTEHEIEVSFIIVTRLLLIHTRKVGRGGR